MHLPYSSWAAFVAPRHRAILAGSFLICVLSGRSLRWLRLDLDVLEMLPHGRPPIDRVKQLVADFGQIDELLVLVRETPGSDVGGARLQAFADEFAAQLVQLDSVASVQDRIDIERLFDGILGRYLPNLLSAAALEEVAQRLTAEGIEVQLSAARAILKAPLDLSAARWIREDPLGLRRIGAAELQRSQAVGSVSLSGGYFMSPEGDALLMLVRPRSGPFDVAFSASLLSQVRAAEAAVRRSMPSQGIAVDYTGGYVYALEDAATIRSDVQRYTLLALVGVLAVFYAGYRDLRILPFVAYLLLVSALVTTEAVVERLESYRREGIVRTVGSVTPLLPSERLQRQRLERFGSLPRAEAAARLRAAFARHGFAAEPFEPFAAWLEREHRDILRLGAPVLEAVAAAIERHVRVRPGWNSVATYVEGSSPAALEAVQGRLRADVGAEGVVLAGRPLLERELGRVLRSEVLGFFLLALAGNLVLLAATFGVRDALVIVVPVAWAALALLAFMSLVGMSLNPVNLIAPTLLLGLGVDFGAFMVARAREEGSMVAAVCGNGRALVVAALTTTAGFGCLGMSVYPALAGMGTLITVGLSLCVLTSLVLLLALWTLVARRHPLD